MSRFNDRLRRLLNPYQPERPEQPPREVGAFLRWTLTPLRWPLIGLIVFSLAVGFSEVAVIYAVGEIVDRAKTSGAAEFLSANAGFLAYFAALILIARPVALLGQSAISSLLVGPNLQPVAIWRLHGHSLGQSIRFFDDDFAGRLAQKQMQSAMSVVSAITDSITTLGMLSAFLLGMGAALGAADPLLGLMVALWAAAYAVILRLTLPTIRGRSKVRAEKRSYLSGLLVDSFTNIRTVKLFDQSGAETRAARAGIEGWREAAVDFGLAVMSLRAALAVLNSVAMLAVLGLSLYRWSEGGATLGVVAAAGMLTLRLTAMSNWIAFTALSIFADLGTIEDGVETLSPPHEVTDAPNAVAAAPRLGDIGRVEFRDVSFAYGKRKGQGGVDDLSLEIAPGEKVGLVGRSGAGKSTMASLLLRFYDVEHGAILVEGRDVRDMTQDSLRARIGVVTQEPAMFNRSALENIRYGRPDATEREVIEAARRASAHDFIATLEDGGGRKGYEARLGERGVKLSGGQRQRIALARVILKDAPILVLDEATSALDSEAEAEILDALRQAMSGKTVIAIAHRLSTIAQMDRIVVLDQGRILESGPHAALLAQGGLYARLWSRQSGGFLGYEQSA